MTYPYGAQGSPQAGRGAPGLPRRTAAGPVQLTTQRAANPLDNTLLKFPPRADWSKGHTATNPVVQGLPSGFGLALGQQWNGGGIGLSSGTAFVMPYQRSGTSEVYLGLFIVSGGIVELADSAVVPADYTSNDGASLHFVRTEYEDTLVLSWAGVSSAASCSSRLYVVKVNEAARRIEVLPDYSEQHGASSTYYNRRLVATYLGNGFVATHMSAYYSSNGYSRPLCIYKITPTGFSAVVGNWNPGSSRAINSISRLYDDGRFTVTHAALTDATAALTKVVLQLTEAGGVSALSNVADYGGIQPALHSMYGASVVQGMRGAICIPHAASSYLTFLPAAEHADAQALMTPAVPAYPVAGTSFFADGGADGVLQVTSDTTKQLIMHAPWMETDDRTWRGAKGMAALDTSTWMAVHLGTSIFCVVANGTSPRLLTANSPL